MTSDHPGGGAKTPPGDGDRIAGASHADAHEQPVDGYAPGFAGLDEWLAAVARAAAADADAPVELLGEYLVILADAALSGRRPEKGSWQQFDDLVDEQQNKASTPTRPSTCTSRRRGDSGGRYRRSCRLLGSARRCGPPPKPCCG